MGNVRVKICGLTRQEDAASAVKAGAWALGFMFYRPSPRFVHPRQARKIIESLPPFITPVGVFVNQSEKQIRQIAKTCHLQTLQFHGDESPAFCRRFKAFRIIKAFRIGERIDIESIQKYRVSAILLDTFRAGLFGGTGQSFNWRLARVLRGFTLPVILSGGLKAGNIQEAVRCVRPFAVDISSGIEKKPGIKDPRKIKMFFRALNKR